MPCFSGEIVNNQIIIPCIVAKAGKSPKEKSTLQHCKALVDTGANASCISDKLASEMGLASKRWEPMVGVHGTSKTRVYTVWIWFETKISFSGKTAIVPPDEVGKGIPDKSIGRYMVGGELEVGELQWEDGDNYDVLLGMDIIKELTLIIRQNENSFTICF